MRTHLATRTLVVAALVAAFATHAQAQPKPAGPKVITAKEAGKLIGRKVFVATGSAMPTGLIRPMRESALARDGRTDVFYMSTFAGSANFTPEVAAKFHPNLFFVSMSNRDAASKGHATIVRDNLFQLGQRIEKGEFGFDTVAVRVSPPDKDGFVSLGTTGDLTMSAVKDVLGRGGQVIAEVNPNVPFTAGNNRVRYDQLAAVYESAEPLPELTQMAPNVAEAQLARNVAKLVPNRQRSTIQVGIGGSLVGIGEALKAKRLRIWSEMGSDWVLPVMSGPKPAAREGTFSFLHGTTALFRHADRNPNVKIDSSLVVNDPKVIASQKRMVAINTALEVDLSGNTNAERIGDKVISAPGGQPNFMEGAATARDGKAILALRSTNKNGDSTLVLGLSGPTTTPGEHVDHVVTEWGATRKMRGMTAGQRAYEIVAVAHPLHRGELGKEALGRGLITQKQHDKLLRGVAPAILRADGSVRAELADQALAKELISPAQHVAILASVPAQPPVPQAP